MRFLATGLTLLTCGLGLILAADQEPTASDWLGFRNDTRAVLIVQDVTPSRRRCNPRLLYPGEVAIDSRTGLVGRRVAIFDLARPGQPLYQGIIPPAPEMALLSIQTGASTIKLVPVKYSLPLSRR